MPLNHQNQFTELTDEHFQAIGRIVVEWANVEYLLGYTLRRLSFNDFLARTFINRMNASQISGAIKDALNVHEKRYQASIISEQTISEIKKIKKEIEELRNVRNDISHLCWMRSDDETIFGTKFSDEPWNGKEDSLKISLTELNQYYQKIHTIVERLQAIAYYQLPPFDDVKVQKMLRFENSGLKAWGREEIVKMRFHQRIYEKYIKRGNG